MALPLINDITTTPDHPPEFQALAELKANKKRDMSYPQKFAEVQKLKAPDIQPLEVDCSPEKAFEIVVKTAHKMPRWKIIRADEQARVLEAVASTFLMHFHDDVIVEVRILDEKTFIHMRSKSRLGKSDMGANARRIRRYFKKIKSSL